MTDNEIKQAIVQIAQQHVSHAFHKNTLALFRKLNREQLQKLLETFGRMLTRKVTGRTLA